MTPSNTLKNRFFSNGLVRIFTGMLVCTAAMVALKLGLAYLLKNTLLPEDISELIAAMAAAATGLMTYGYFFNWYDRRKITELSTTHLLRDVSCGLLIGTVLQTLTIAVICLNHGFRIVAFNQVADILPWMGMSIAAAVGEELIFRGIIFRIAEEKLGSNWALAISSFIFGAAHFFNPAATVLSSLSIALEAGLLLGGAYMATRSIWLAVAIHFAWDFVQAGVFGVTTSGNAAGKSLISSVLSGPEIITGGKFGPEVSVQAALFCLAAAAGLITFAYRSDSVIRHVRRSV